MNTLVPLTVETIPRSLEGLDRLGIFQLRLLIERLGGMPTHEHMVQFAKMDSKEKVRLARDLLLEHDQGGGPLMTRFKEEAAVFHAREADVLAKRRSRDVGTILKGFIKSAGWNKADVTRLLCAYIDEQGRNDEFEDFLQDRVNEESDG
jgi:hypothetical protein